MADDPVTGILEATHPALCRHGYADVTVADVAAEADRSTAAIHYHFESKEALFTSLLSFLSERHSARISAIAADGPRARLRAIVEAAVVGDRAESGRDFRAAMVAVGAQAPYDAAVRATLTRFDDFLAAELRETIAGAHSLGVAVDHSAEHLAETITRDAEAHLQATASAEGAS